MLVQRRSTSSNILSSPEILENIRKEEEKRRDEEKKKEWDAMVRNYFRKEESRMRENIKYIKMDDTLFGSQKLGENRVRKEDRKMKNNFLLEAEDNLPLNQSFYCVHMLLRYQEGMLSESYIPPSPRRGIYHDNNDDDLSVTGMS